MKFEDIENKIFLGDCQELLPHILEKVDRSKVILVSDPPFNVNYHYNTYKDNLDEEDIKKWKSPHTKVKGEVLLKVLKTFKEHHDCKFIFVPKKDMGKKIIELLGGKNGI